MQRTFPSGFTVEDACAATLDPDALFTDSIADFKRLPIQEKVKALHAIAERVWQGRIARERYTLNAEQTRGLSLRLESFFVSSRESELPEYAPELAVIAGKLGYYASASTPLSSDYREFLEDTIELTKKVSLGDPREDNDLRARLISLQTFILNRELVQRPTYRNLSRAINSLQDTLDADRVGLFQLMGLESSLNVLLSCLEAWPQLPEATREMFKPILIEVFKIPIPMLDMVILESNREAFAPRFPVLRELIRRLQSTRAIDEFDHEAGALEDYLPKLATPIGERF